MTLIRRGRTYWIDVRVSGKRIRRSLETDDKTLALYRYKEKHEQILLEYSGKKAGFSTFCDKYIEWAWSSHPASASHESQRLNKIKEFFIGMGIIYLEDITPYHIEQLKVELKSWGLSKTTVNHYLQLLRGLFNRAIEWDVYDKQNPLKRVRWLKATPNVESLSAADVEKVIRAAREISRNPKTQVQKVILDVILFALNTGLRKSEIIMLKWKNIKGDEIIIKGKGEKIRSVPLNSISQAILEKQIQKNSFVFDIPGRYQKDVLNWTIKKIEKSIGRRFHLHLLRHYFASRLVAKGVDFITVASILGHSKTMTSLGYMHTDKERKKKAVDLII